MGKLTISLVKSLLSLIFWVWFVICLAINPGFIIVMTLFLLIIIPSPILSAFVYYHAFKFFMKRMNK